MQTTAAIDYKTMQAGRELDAMVATQITGWVEVHYDGKLDRLRYKWYGYAPCEPREVAGSKLGEIATTNTEPYLSEIPAYSTDIAAAFQVVEKLKERVCVLLRTVHDQSENNWCVEFWGLHSQQYAHNGVKVYADTLPLAICKAALALAATK